MSGFPTTSCLLSANFFLSGPALSIQKFKCCRYQRRKEMRGRQRINKSHTHRVYAATTRGPSRPVSIVRLATRTAAADPCVRVSAEGCWPRSPFAGPKDSLQRCDERKSCSRTPLGTIDAKERVVLVMIHRRRKWGKMMKSPVQVRRGGPDANNGTENKILVLRSVVGGNKPLVPPWGREQCSLSAGRPTAISSHAVDRLPYKCGYNRGFSLD